MLGPQILKQHKDVIWFIIQWLFSYKVIYNSNYYYLLKLSYKVPYIYLSFIFHLMQYS